MLININSKQHNNKNVYHLKQNHYYIMHCNSVKNVYNKTVTIQNSNYFKRQYVT